MDKHNLTFDIAEFSVDIIENKNFGNEHFSVTNQCIFKDGKPWLPAMGEIHFSRVPENQWDKTLKLMKEGGLSIASTYLFWNHHEEIKGKFNFDGIFNIRKFIQKCEEHGLMAFVRIGPWVHGEGRNGGFPDWLVTECAEACKDMDMKWEFSGVGTRRKVEPYMTYAKRYLNRILDEIKDFKNIVGIQIENEMSNCPEYLSELKKIVLESGIDVPIYTATGWANARIGEDIIPSYGTYADRAWIHHMEDISDAPSYFPRNKPNSKEDIGTDILTVVPGNENDYMNAVPYITCELGGGVATAYHRRPMTYPEDISALVMCAIASGVNLAGMFMYRGGYNPIGVNSTLQESIETNYPSDYPVISYDFQAPIGEAGQIRKHYFLLKDLFEFCHNFEETLALMPVVLPNEMPESEADKETVRCSVRTDGKSGFLFVNNHNHIIQLKEKKDVSFDIKLSDETISIPIKSIPSGSQFYLPFNLKCGELLIKYATAIPVKADEGTVIFTEISGIEPVICKENGDIIVLHKEQVIDGVKIIVRKPFKYKISEGEILSVKRAEKNSETFEYFRHLKLEDNSVEYVVNVPEDARYLKLKWNGNVAAAFANHRLICDQFYNGDFWVIDVSDLESDEIVVKILPMDEKEVKRVYLNVRPEIGITSLSAECIKSELIYV